MNSAKGCKIKIPPLNARTFWRSLCLDRIPGLVLTLVCGAFGLCLADRMLLDLFFTTVSQVRTIYGWPTFRAICIFPRV
jgi:hypothetical protein